MGDYEAGFVAVQSAVRRAYAPVAQLEEQRISTPSVGGSTPSGRASTLFAPQSHDYVARMMTCRPLLPLLLLGVAAPAAADTGGGTLHVVIDNVRGSQGRVHVDLCTEQQFLKDCPVAADAPAHPGASIVTLSGLRPGRYAAQVFYDENANRKVDRALFGIPKEGVGFSRDARIKLGPPKWDEAVFDYDGREQTIRLRLRYFIGPDYTGPGSKTTAAK